MKYVILRITYCKRSWARRQAKLLEKATQRERESWWWLLLLLLRDQFEQRKLIFAKTRNINLFAKKTGKNHQKKKHIKQKLDPQYLICFWLFWLFSSFLMFALVCFFPVRPYTLHVVGLLSLVLVRVGSQLDENFQGGWVQHSGRQEGHVPWTLLQVQEMCQSPELLRHLDHFGSLGSLEFSMFPAVIEYVE